MLPAGHFLKQFECAWLYALKSEVIVNYDNNIYRRTNQICTICEWKDDVKKAFIENNVHGSQCVSLKRVVALFSCGIRYLRTNYTWVI